VQWVTVRERQSTADASSVPRHERDGEKHGAEAGDADEYQSNQLATAPGEETTLW
jgi:hypothetical protein